MDNTIPPLLSGSEAIHEPLSLFPTSLSYAFTDQGGTIEMQSASVTASGYLWQRNLASREPITESNLRSLRLSPNTSNDVQAQKRQALVQLLRGWCEDDAQEQYDTLEYLKQALDEDRLSNRKLFQ
jgi:hypothetical protein